MQRISLKTLFRMNTSPVPVLTVIVVFCLVSCVGTTSWENRNIDQSLWSRDQSHCRRDSEKRAGVEQERELGRSGTIGRQGSYRNEMIRYDSSRYALQLYEACLRARGYQKVESDRQ